MKKLLRFEITTEDRMGITVEILQKMYKANINLISVEVFSRKVCVKIENINEEKKELLKRELYNISDVVDIREIELLHHEENEERLRAIIDSVDEGIIAIDKNFRVEIFNNYCEEVFRYKKEEVLGTDVRKLIGGDAPMVNLIRNGEKYDNVEYNIRNERGEIHYITTGRPIRDESNKTIGAVATVKDINKAIELVNVISSMEEGAFKDIIGSSPLLEKVKSIAAMVAKGNSTVLLRGESGTGKELFARAIHNLSPRKNKNFVPVNCAALPDSLLESELFGYEKGSFTGALISGREGLFKEADEGTLFLDEIGELSMALQAKLLRVLQEGVIRKIGSSREEKVDVRIIAATNKNLEEMIKNRSFREDLYYRLNVIPVYIPPLRDRKEDIPMLAGYFINRLNKRLNKTIAGADINFMNMLMEYIWPGNVRELQNVIERAMNLCEAETLGRDNLIMDFQQKPQAVIQKVKTEGRMNLKEALELHEKEAIKRAIEESGSLRKAGKALGISHTAVMNKVKKYNIMCKD